jgi:hypothetical protein
MLYVTHIQLIVCYTHMRGTYIELYVTYTFLVVCCTHVSTMLPLCYLHVITLLLRYEMLPHCRYDVIYMHMICNGHAMSMLLQCYLVGVYTVIVSAITGGDEPNRIRVARVTREPPGSR